MLMHFSFLDNFKLYYNISYRIAFIVYSKTAGDNLFIVNFFKYLMSIDYYDKISFKL